MVTAFSFSFWLAKEVNLFKQSRRTNTIFGELSLRYSKVSTPCHPIRRRIALSEI